MEPDCSPFFLNRCSSADWTTEILVVVRHSGCSTLTLCTVGLLLSPWATLHLATDADRPDITPSCSDGGTDSSLKEPPDQVPFYESS